MNEMKIGKYTVIERMAENVTEEEKENSLRLLKEAVIRALEKNEKR